MLAAAGADDPAGTLRPLLEAALDNALAYGDAALTGPIVRGDVDTVRPTSHDLAATRARHAAVVRRDGARHADPRGRRRPAAADPGRQDRRPARRGAPQHVADQARDQAARRAAAIRRRRRARLQ